MTDQKWLRIEFAPKTGVFWCQRPEPNNDQLVLVQRGLPEHGVEAVINYRLGKFWQPEFFLPFDAIPSYPTQS